MTTLDFSTELKMLFPNANCYDINVMNQAGEPAYEVLRIIYLRGLDERKARDAKLREKVNLLEELNKRRFRDPAVAMVIVDLKALLLVEEAKK